MFESLRTRDIREPVRGIQLDPEVLKVVDATAKANRWFDVNSSDLRGNFQVVIGRPSDLVSIVSVEPVTKLSDDQLARGKTYAGQVKFWYRGSGGQYPVYYNGKPI